MVVYSCFDESAADGVIREQIAWCRHYGTELEWKVNAMDRPTDLVRKLERHGFSVGPMSSVMLYDLHDGLEGIAAPNHVSVRRIETEADLCAFRRAAEELFEKDFSFTTGDLRHAIASGNRYRTGFLGYAEGQVASIGCLNSDAQSQFAALFCGGTLPEFRKCGIYRAVVAARARYAGELGIRYLHIDALPSSEPIMRRMGFEQVSTMTVCAYDGRR